MRRIFVLTAALLLLGTASISRLHAQTNAWSFDLTLYGVAAGMDGDVTVHGIPADLDVGFDDVLKNLEFGAMGRVRVGYDRWAISTDVIYMALGASKNGVSADIDQWMVQPQLEYHVCRSFDAYAGARYNNLHGEIRGPLGRNPTGTQAWWDPVIGARISLPIVKKLSFDLRGDVGGFGINSDLTWQVEPVLNWRFTKWGSVQAGYRLLSTDYETGSGGNKFRYDVLVHGPQLGFTLHF